MKRGKLLSGITMMVGIVMISIGLFMQNKNEFKNINISKAVMKEYNVNNIATSANEIIKDTEKKEGSILLREVEMETAPASVIIPPRIEVYEGMTIEELGDKLNRNLGSDILAGKGLFIATECINKGVDPYVATAIILHETGCKSRCSSLARYCNNFGGQKGSPGCNGGSYKAFNSIEEGLVGFVNNLSKNYYSMGLNTVEKIGPKYAEGNTWVGKINWFVNKIRES